MASKGALQDVQAQTAGAAGKAQQQMGTFTGAAAPGYETFAATGGITPAEAQLTREQTASGLSALYNNQMQNLMRRNAVQGGYSPGFGANQRALTRDLSSATGQALNATNLGLLQQKRAGQLAGLGGLTNLSGQQAGLIPSLYDVSTRAAAATPSPLDYLTQMAQIAGSTAIGLGGWRGIRNPTTPTTSDYQTTSTGVAGAEYS